MNILHLLNTTMTVTRPTDSTTAGATSSSYSAHLSGIACRWHRLSGAETVRYGAERTTRLWRGSVEAAVDVLKRDKCTFTDDTGSHSVYVIDVRDSSGGLSNSTGVIRVIEAEEVT